MEPIHYPNGVDFNPVSFTRLSGDWWRAHIATNLRAVSGRAHVSGHLSHEKLMLVKRKLISQQPQRLRTVCRRLMDLDVGFVVSTDYGREDGDFITLRAPRLRVPGKCYDQILAILRNLPYTGTDVSTEQEQDAHGIMEDALSGA